MVYFYMGNLNEAVYPLRRVQKKTLQTKERRVANECYIFGFVPILYICCSPCQSVLSDFQGQKIAAITANNDGLN